MPKNAKLDRFILEVARGKSIAAAAKVVGVSVRTAFRKIKDPAIAGRIDEIRNRLLDGAVARLAAMSATAARRLRRLLDSEDERVVLLAARTVLQIGPALRDSRELANRVAELELEQRKADSDD